MLVGDVAFAKRNSPVEGEKAFNKSVEVASAVLIRLYPHNARGGKVGAPTVSTCFVIVRAARFVIKDPVPLCRLHLSQICARKMITNLRKIVVGRIDLRCENGF